MKKHLLLFIIGCATLNITAQPFVIDTLSEAVVTGIRGETNIEKLPATISTISHDALSAKEQISILPTLSELIPGLFVTSRGILGYGVSDGAAGGISIRGMQSGNGRVMVLIDGHPQYQGIFGHSISDAYQTVGVERVEVVRGPASMLYGSNGMGGVINLITRKAPAKGSKTDIHTAWGSYGTFEGSIANRLRSGSFHSSVSGQYSRTDGHRPRLGFEQISGQGKIGYDFGAHWKAEAMADVTSFIAHYPGTVQAPLLEARQKVMRAQAALSVDNDYGFTSGRIGIYHNWGDHKINDGHAPDAAPKTTLFRSQDALTGINIYQSAALWAGNTITLGFDYQRIRGEAWNRSISTGQRTGTSIDTIQHDVAGYIDVRQQFLRIITAEAGVRVDHHSQTGTTFIPQFGISASLPHRASIKATIGKGFRNPTLRELYMWKPANDQLEPERLWNYELSWSQHLQNARINYSINVYLLRADNLIQTAMVDGAPRNVNTGEARNIGVEAQANWQICSFLALTTNHSFVHMKTPMLDTPRYKGYLGFNLKTSQWRANLGAQAISHLYTAVGNAEAHQSFVLLSALIAFRPLPQMEIYAKGDNLLARRYETRMGYPMPRATVMCGLNLSF